MSRATQLRLLKALDRWGKARRACGIGSRHESRMWRAWQRALARVHS